VWYIYIYIHICVYIYIIHISITHYNSHTPLPKPRKVGGLGWIWQGKELWQFDGYSSRSYHCYLKVHFLRGARSLWFVTAGWCECHHLVKVHCVMACCHQLSMCNPVSFAFVEYSGPSSCWAERIIYDSPKEFSYGALLALSPSCCRQFYNCFSRLAMCRSTIRMRTLVCTSVSHSKIIIYLNGFNNDCSVRWCNVT